MLSRIKIMGSIDISEKRRPQDGRIKMTVHGKHFDLRVSILPTNHGQSVVMRILDRGSIQVSIKDLGFAEDDYKRFQTDHQAAQRHLPGHRARPAPARPPRCTPP